MEEKRKQKAAQAEEQGILCELQFLQVSLFSPEFPQDFWVAWCKNKRNVFVSYLLVSKCSLQMCFRFTPQNL